MQYELSTLYKIALSVSHNPKVMCKLRKDFYGLKQAPTLSLRSSS